MASNTFVDSEFKDDQVAVSEIVLKLTEEEDLALRCEMNPCSWIANALHNRARISIDNVTSQYVREALENGWAIPQSKIEILRIVYNKVQQSSNNNM